MLAKIAVLFAVVAVAYAGVLVQSPASTTLLANQVVQPVQLLGNQQILGVQQIAGGNRVIVNEPVEQHGYRIAY